MSRTVWVLGLSTLAVAVPVVWHLVDREALVLAWRAAAHAPVVTAAVVGAYGGAFALRAAAWRRLVPDLPFGQALAGIHLALGGNHVLPLRLGEPLRVLSVVRRTATPAATATSSTLTLRAADLAGLAAIGIAVGAYGVATPEVLSRWGVALLGVPLALAGAGSWWLHRQRRAAGGRLRLPGPGVAAAATAAWALEATVIWHAAQLVGVELGAAQALAVTAASVAGQIAAVAPAGVGTYEAAGTAALVALGVEPATGLAVAVTAHAVKTGYALAAGGLAVVLPPPGLLGRVRLPTPPAPRLPPPPADPPGPVVLFLPARNEEDTVAAVVRRVPARVAGRPVRCVVVDDGSGDATAARATEAGARVVSHPVGRGLGAAVRSGLVDAVTHQPAAVAFCDADGEYAPEELAAVVEPVLTGEADYVVGSRFTGRIERMRPHRRLGNRLLTRWLAFVARRSVSDGQSGYRALSRRAAAGAEIAHDFNYAQVLTLDLFAKGYRYAEVPITYRFRAHGRSYVRLLPYLRAVLPAMWRVANRRPVSAPAPG